MGEIKIKPLSKSTLHETSDLAVKVFKGDINDEDYPPKWFEASLNFKKNKKAHQEFHVTSSRYWVAVRKKEGFGGCWSLYTFIR